MINTRILFLIILFVTSCEPEEIPIDGCVDGCIDYIQVELGSDYCYQKYYNLTTNIIVNEHFMTEWDLAFSNEANMVMLNSSKYMGVIAIDSTLNPQLIINSINNNNWSYDNPNGDLSLVAFHQNLDLLSKSFFLVDRGYDCITNHLGYFIIQIIDYDENSYFIQTIDLIELDDNTTWHYNEIIEIDKQENTQYNYFSFISNSVVNIVNEPWDLCFLRYTEFNVPSPGGNNDLQTLPTYRVVGVLQNSHISVAVDSINDFSDINMNNITSYEFSMESNSIGYDWKYYDPQLGLYAIDSPVYIIQKSNSEYYKLLFLDFYNEFGDKGAPLFQIERI